MGRPRLHDAQAAADLLEAAEEIVDAEGLAALSVRSVAHKSGLTVRALYSVYGSKDDLLAGLAARAFDVLYDLVAPTPVTEHPEEDLLEAGLRFRRFATERPALYELVCRLDQPAPSRWPSSRAAQQKAWGELRTRVERLIGDRVPDEAIATHTRSFHAMCEGLAALEARGACPPAEAPAMWRSGLGLCIAGMRASE